MKQSCVSAFTRVTRYLALAAVALMVGASALSAQAATGKLEGKVRDQQGAPIANAQVIIVGTKFGAQTNADGYYFINLIPAGTISLEVSFIGYKKTRVTDIRIPSGQTITADVTLESTPVEVTEITVVAAQNELVPRDAVTTKQNVEGDYADNLPADRIVNVLALQPGVVASASGGTISIRGGRTDEQSVYVDGVPVGAGNRGGGFVTGGGNSVGIGTNAFEDASITTGASSAAFGGAQSGVISISTRTGGDKFSGAVGYESDGLFGNSVSLGFNRVTASLSGPIVSNLTFFIGGNIEGQRLRRHRRRTGTTRRTSPWPAIDTIVAVPSVKNSAYSDTTYVNVAGIRGVHRQVRRDDDVRRHQHQEQHATPTSPTTTASTARASGCPARPTRRTSCRASSTTRYGAGSRIFLSANASQAQGRNFTYANLYNPQQIFGQHGQQPGLHPRVDAEPGQVVGARPGARRDPVLPAGRVHPVAAHPGVRGEQPRSLRRLHALAAQVPVRLRQLPAQPGTAGQLPAEQRRLPARAVRLENTAQYALVDKWRNNAYGLLGFSEAGGPTGRLFLNQENRFIGAAALDWQVDRYNRLKIGGGYTDFDIKSYSSAADEPGLLRLLHGEADVLDRVRRRPARPRRRGARGRPPVRLLQLQRVAPAVLRLDAARASRPSGSRATRSTTRTTSRPRSSRSTSRTSPTTTSPPHIQVSFPVSDRTNMRFSYAHQVQPPDFALVLGGINTDLAVTNTNHVYGSDLDFGKTITFEFGIRHAFSDDFVLDFSAYNRDAQSNQAGRLLSLYDPLKLQNQDIRMMTNQDYGNYRGFDIRLDKRIGSLFNGTLAYSFSDAKNTGSDPFTYINFGSRIVNQISGGNDPPPSAYLPTTYTRPHNLAGSFSVTFPNGWNSGSTTGAILQNVGIFATFRVASGTAYTRCPVETGNESVLSTQVCARQFEGDVNGSRLPTFRNADLRLTKGFRFGGVDLTAYLDARNVFNFTNTTTVFAENNSIENAVELQETWSGDSAGYADEAIASNSYDRRERRHVPADPGRLRQLGDPGRQGRRPELRVPGPGRGALRQRRRRLHPVRTAPGVGSVLLLGPQRGELHRRAPAPAAWVGAQFLA